MSRRSVGAIFGGVAAGLGASSLAGCHGEPALALAANADGLGASACSYQAVRTLSPSSCDWVLVAGRAVAGDGGAGIFVFDAAADSADDDGTVLAPDPALGITGRWKRVYAGSLDVRWFSSVQAAVDAMPDDGGDLLLPPGVYLHDTEIQISGKSRFRIAGYGAVLKSSPSAPLASQYGGLRFQGCHQFTVEGLTVDGNRAQRGGAEVPVHLFFVLGTASEGPNTDFAFIRCRAVDSPCDGFYSGTMDPQTAINRGGAFIECVAENSYRCGLSIIEGHELRVIGGSYGGSNGTAPECGIDLEPDPQSGSDAVRDIVIQSAVIRGNLGNGLQGSDNPGSRQRNVQILGNTIVENGNRGVWMSGLSHSRVEGNDVRGNAYRGINLSNCEYTAVLSNSVIGNNTVPDEQSAAIVLEKGDPDGLAVTGCRLADNVVREDEVGIAISGVSAHNTVHGNVLADLQGVAIRVAGASRIAITGNHIEGCGYDGIELAAGGVADAVVAGNVIAGVGAGCGGDAAHIFVGGFNSRVLVAGNVCGAHGAPQAAYGIQLQNNHVDAITVVGNELSGSGAVADLHRAASATTICRDNRLTGGPHAGAARLVAGSVQVGAPAVTADTRILLSIGDPAGTVGAPYVGEISPGSGFRIDSTSTGDGSLVFWGLIH